MDERHTRLADLQTCLIDEPSAARLRIVFLHGYDMQASDLTPFAHSLAIPGVAYAFPQAPTASHGRGDPDLSFDAGQRLAEFVQATLGEVNEDITRAYETH